MKAQWLRLLCGGVLALTSLFAQAQYSWIDEKGSRVFSDRPPPPDTPPSRILKTPRGLEPPPSAAAPEAAKAPATAGENVTPDWQKREADYRERMVKRDKEEREADEKRRLERAAECSWARGTQKQLETARRLEWKNNKGEQEAMSDEDRGREQQRVRQILSRCG